MKRLPPRQGYDLYANDYRKDHPHLDSFMNGAESEAWYRALDLLLADRSTVRAIDLGCGDGRTLGRWARGVAKRNLTDRVELWGTDVSPNMITAARRRIEGVQWDVLDGADASALGQWRETHGAADLVSAFFVLVHFPRPEVFFGNLAALLAPGGRLVMNTLPQPKAPELRAQGKPIVIEAWDHRTEEVVNRGEAAGFVLDRQKEFQENSEEVSTLLEWSYPGSLG